MRRVGRRVSARRSSISSGNSASEKSWKRTIASAGKAATAAIRTVDRRLAVTRSERSSVDRDRRERDRDGGELRDEQPARPDVEQGVEEELAEHGNVRPVGRRSGRERHSVRDPSGADDRGAERREPPRVRPHDREKPREPRRSHDRSGRSGHAELARAASGARCKPADLCHVVHSASPP